MRIVVTSSGVDLRAPASPLFGRCRAYVFVETESMTFEAVENPAIGAASGAGIQAAQFVVQQGAGAVVTGNLGPNAYDVFQSAGVPVYLFGGGTVRQAAEAFKTGLLQSIGGATTQAGTGIGALAGSAAETGGPQWNVGIGRGRGMGRGRGRGLGADTGRGMGRGMRPRWDAEAQASGGPIGTPTPLQPVDPQAKMSRDQEIATLKDTAQQLEDQLSRVMERLEELDNEG
jgi:predicted Fe-Mo cluster-binding NifX family protein